MFVKLPVCMFVSEVVVCQFVCLLSVIQVQRVQRTKQEEHFCHMLPLVMNFSVLKVSLSACSNLHSF